MPPFEAPRRRTPVESSVPTAIFALLVVNGLMFALQQFLDGTTGAGQQYVAMLMLWSVDSGFFLPFQVITYSFLHGSPTHLLFNMFMLWMFGRDIERAWGAGRFALYYFVCVAGAAVTQLAVAAFQGSSYPTLGASGGVFGILLAYGMLYPDRRLFVMPLPVPIPARYAVVGFGLFELFVGVSGYAPGVAHFAHLGGMFFGFVLIMRWRQR